MSWLADFAKQRESERKPQGSTLAEQWVNEVADAKRGAQWFTSWSPGEQARWAASLLWVAREDLLEIPGDLMQWIEALARGYHE